MKTLVVFGVALVTGVSVFSFSHRTTDSEPRMTALKTAIKSPGSGMAGRALTGKSDRIKQQPVEAQITNRLVAALGGSGESSRQPWWEVTPAGAKPEPVSRYVAPVKKADRKLLETIRNKAARAAEPKVPQVKKNIAYEAPVKNRRVSAGESDSLKVAALSARKPVAVRAPVSTKTVPEKGSRMVPAGKSLNGKGTVRADKPSGDHKAAKPLKKVAVLSNSERRGLGRLVEQKKLHALDMVIEFDYKSAKLTDRALPLLARIGKALKDGRLADATFVIAGHTDSVGSNRYNMNLSAQRAASVRDYLRKVHHIEARRLVAVGYGEERLKNKKDPEAAENRRVEFINLVR